MIQSFPSLYDFQIKQNTHLLESGKCPSAITKYTVIRTVNLSAYPVLVFWIL